jgi:predicted transcriptional regulator
MATTTTSLKLDDALKARIQRLAEQRKRTPHWLMKEAIEEFVTREELRDKAWREANEAIEEYDRTGLHLTNAEVVEWLDRLADGEDVDPPPCHT